jgi:hypothetical protein
MGSAGLRVFLLVARQIPYIAPPILILSARLLFPRNETPTRIRLLPLQKVSEL